MSAYTDKGAIISADGRYRYLLWREWRGSASDENWSWFGAKDGAGAELGEPKSCVFVMLNPSTADEDIDDPTIRRGVAYAKAWKYDRLEVINLFAYRTPSPTALLALSHNDDPVGYENQRYVDMAMGEVGRIVCAWGAHGNHLGQNETMLGWLGSRPKFALGFTKNGQPRHPLYLRSDAPLEAMK